MDLPRILYVDDEVINLELFQLTFLGDFEVVMAESAQEGLELLDRCPEIQVVISDLKMPVMNGLEFITQVKKNDPARICMILTAFKESEFMLEGFDKELIYRYLVKPWDRERLKNTILDALAFEEVRSK